MSGLLDKAKKTVVASQPATITTTTTTTTTSDVMVAVMDVENEETNIGVLVGMQIVGVVGLLVSMFLLVQTGWLYATLFDYLLAILVMAVGWAIFNGSDYLSSGLSQSKMIITAVGFASLFIVTIIGTVFMNAGGGVTIASIELDGEMNDIDLSFFGPSGMGYTVEVFVDGTVQYSHDAEINIDRGSHSIPLEEFWVGNSMNMNDKIEVTYEIRVTSEGGNDSVTFNDIMNREVDTAFVKVTEVFDNDGDGKEYTGIRVAMIVGMGDPDANYGFDNNLFTGDAPKPIASDWDATLVVKKANGGLAYGNYGVISADEGVVKGMMHNGASLPYSGEFYFDWVIMPGTSGDELARDDFYDGDECYTFEVTVTNVLGDEFVSTDSRIEFFWDANEANGDDQPAKAC